MQQEMQRESGGADGASGCVPGRRLPLGALNAVSYMPLYAVICRYIPLTAYA